MRRGEAGKQRDEGWAELSRSCRDQSPRQEDAAQLKFGGEVDVYVMNVKVHVGVQSPAQRRIHSC